MGSCKGASWRVWNWWERGPAVQYPRTSPSGSLSRQELSPGQSMGTGETHMAFLGVIQSVPETLSPFPTPSEHPSCSPSLSPWHSIPMASRGPHGITRSPWHHCVPVASWGPCGVPVASDALGPMAAWLMMCKGTSLSLSGDGLVAATVSQRQG